MKAKKDMGGQYDNYAAKWTAHIRSRSDIAHEYLEKPAMRRLMPDISGRDVLCLGCGEGLECLVMKKLGARSIKGVDASEKLIEQAKDEFKDIDFYVGQADNLSFKNGEFDFIYSSLTMHYIRNWDKALREIKRVLKRQGIFLFSTHHPVRYAMEKLKSPERGLSSLGYAKYRDGKSQVFGDYFEERRIDDLWFNEFKVSYWHRPLRSLIKDIISSGFEIIDYDEPQPIEKAKIDKPQFWMINNRIPLFVIFKLKKV